MDARHDRRSCLGQRPAASLHVAGDAVDRGAALALDGARVDQSLGLVAQPAVSLLGLGGRLRLCGTVDGERLDVMPRFVDGYDPAPRPPFTLRLHVSGTRQPHDPLSVVDRLIRTHDCDDALHRCRPCSRVGDRLQQNPVDVYATAAHDHDGRLGKTGFANALQCFLDCRAAIKVCKHAASKWHGLVAFRAVGNSRISAHVDVLRSLRAGVQLHGPADNAGGCGSVR